jgi:hypothetical protein
MKHALDWSEPVREKVGNFLDESEIVAVDLAQRKHIEVIAEKADMF